MRGIIFFLLFFAFSCTQEKNVNKAETYFQMSLDYYNKALKNKALEYIEKACTIKKDPRYLMQKAILLHKGSKKHNKFNKYIKEIRKNNDSFSYYVIGYCYDNGFEGKQNDIEAMIWYIKAANSGSSLAMESIGDMCRPKAGIADAEALHKAYKWYKKAADSGNLSSMIKIGRMHAFRDLKQRDHTKKAFIWRKKAADLGNIEAMRSVGDAYLHGSGVKKNYQEALKWYNKSAAFGNINALERIALMYYRGSGVKKNYREAFKWFKKAASISNYYMDDVGDMYYQGHGVEQNYKKAFECYKKSALDGNHWMWKKLGDMYIKGKGVEKDKNKALEYYEKYDHLK